MTPERCKDLVTDFDTPQLQRVPCGHVLPCPLHTPPSPKPSESSIVQRIEALERALEAAEVTLRRIGEGRTQPFGVDVLTMSVGLDAADAARVARLGPPDPERDRETRDETERP